MKQASDLTKKNFNKKYGTSPIPALFLYAGGKKVFYANLSAKASYGRLSEDGQLASLLCDGWQRLLRTAVKNDGVAFIDLKDKRIFSHARLIPMKINGRTGCYAVNLIPADAMKTTEHDMPMSLCNEGSEYVKLFNTLCAAKSAFEDDPQVLEKLTQIEKSVFRLYDFRTDVIEFLWKNLFANEDCRKVFDVTLLLTVAESDAYPFDVGSDDRAAGKNLYVNGNFFLYRAALAEAARILCSSTPDTSRIKVSVKATEETVSLFLYKKGMTPRLGAVAENTARPTPLLYFMETLLGAIKVKINFTATADGFCAEIFIPRYFPEPK